MSRWDTRTRVSAFVIVYLIALTWIHLLLCGPGCLVIPLGLLAIGSCLFCASTDKAMRLIALIGTVVALAFAMSDHLMGVNNKISDIGYFEERLRDCEQRAAGG